MWELAVALIRLPVTLLGFAGVLILAPFILLFNFMAVAEEWAAIPLVLLEALVKNQPGLLRSQIRFAQASAPLQRSVQSISGMFVAVSRWGFPF